MLATILQLYLATHYGPDFYVLLGSPFLLVAAILGIIGAAACRPILLIISGGTIICFMYVATLGRSYEYELNFTMTFDSIAGIILFVMNWVGVRKRNRWPRFVAEEQGSGGWILAMLCLVLAQAVTAVVVFALFNGLMQLLA